MNLLHPLHAKASTSKLIMAAKFCNLILQALFSEYSHNLLLPNAKFRYATCEKIHLEKIVIPDSDGSDN